ncbi:hypothetical protein [Bacillus licheniformis]|uniref:hypothetical protein n=1 Tax=Bacillus licheniformis TaxID=1402 RepID=UPI00211C41A4|nr:hypothetical protein [Bacillus licheniformis]
MKYKKAAALGIGLLLFIADVRRAGKLKSASKITQDRIFIFIVEVIRRKPLRSQKRIEMKLKKR